MEYVVIYFEKGFAVLNRGYNDGELSSLGEIKRLELKKIDGYVNTEVLKTWYFEK